MRLHLTTPLLLTPIAITLSALMTEGASAVPAMHNAQEPAAVHEWTLVSSFSYSFINKGFDNWDKETVELYRYLPQQRLLLGAGVDLENRSTNDDIVYRFNAAWYATDTLELHGGVGLTQDPDFLPSEKYTLGLAHRIHPSLELLLDVDHMEFSGMGNMWDDGITQIRPGFTWWFDEHKRVTLRYTHGWVHDSTDYDYYSVKFHIGELLRDGTLSVGLAYGTDPDFGFGTGTLLSDAYLLSVFYTEPVSEDLTVYAGVEYVYRMRPGSHGELYQMWTPTIGLSWKF